MGGRGERAWRYLQGYKGDGIPQPHQQRRHTYMFEWMGKKQKELKPNTQKCLMLRRLPGASIYTMREKGYPTRKGYHHIPPKILVIRRDLGGNGGQLARLPPKAARKGGEEKRSISMGWLE
ncbi:hypothetical protein AWENTII_000124 [Aspergillus wentii]